MFLALINDRVDSIELTMLTLDLHCKPKPWH